MLVGTRSGYVFEVTLKTEFVGLKNIDDELNNSGDEEDNRNQEGMTNLALKKIEFQANPIFRYHATQD